MLSNSPLKIPQQPSNNFRKEEIEMAKISKKMKRILDILGEPYEAKPIDWEMCIYRDLKNGYDVEVSGINHPERGKICNFVAVWDVTNGKNYCARTVEYVRDIKSLPELKSILDGLCEKYGSKHSANRRGTQRK